MTINHAHALKAELGDRVYSELRAERRLAKEGCMAELLVSRVMDADPMYALKQLLSK